ncbi:hypothetical protein DPMN_096557 [Dreissena polymorpha]|uniref:Uncharacterized protein n=1 Tax=Dreissena polymorpha TaxID=45954 RepID=A0A9D4L8Y6_DREPO|nr:hypothetical protein DPMN_096557 [Dreissena polymorpha]
MTLEANEIHSCSIPTSSSNDYIQTTDLAVGSTETGSESNVEAESYMVSINQVYEMMFHTLGEDYCPRPSMSATSSAISITEQLARKHDPNRISKATSHVDFRLPFGSTTMSVFQSLEPSNKPSPSPWKVPKDLTEPNLKGSKSYKPPVPDPTTGLDFPNYRVQIRT